MRYKKIKYITKDKKIKTGYYFLIYNGSYQFGISKTAHTKKNIPECLIDFTFDGTIAANKLSYNHLHKYMITCSEDTYSTIHVASLFINKWNIVNFPKYNLLQSFYIFDQEYYVKSIKHKYNSKKWWFRQKLKKINWLYNLGMKENIDYISDTLKNVPEKELGKYIIRKEVK